jgi:HEAT repeat protein
MMRLHLLLGAVTWTLEAAIRMANAPPGPAAQAGTFPLMLAYTVWVPFVDCLAFAGVSMAVAILLVRQRLDRYLEELARGEPDQRMRAARACEFLGRTARRAVPELLVAAADPDAELRYAVLRALGSICPVDPAEAEPVHRALTDRDDRVRTAAACVLAIHGLADGSAVLAGVTTALASNDDDMKAMGVRAATNIGPAAAAAVEPLGALAAEHWRLSNAAIVALKAIGPAAEPTLRKLSVHKDPVIRGGASGALSCIERGR